jgi:uncharacterized protein with HEPN domain
MYSSINDIIRHIYDETQYLLSKSNVEYDDFIDDPTLQRAFTRSIEIIGEASKKLSSDFKIKHSEIDWRAISGMRDKLIHDYFGVDFDLVYDVVKNDIPVLDSFVQIILNQHKLF